MGLYKYMKELFQDKRELLRPIEKERLIQWRKEPAIVRIDKPTRVDRARRLGYKAKQGIIVVRVRIKKGGRKRERMPKGRRPKRYGLYFTPTKNLQAIAEMRANRKFPNLEVLNSYLAGEDGKHKWFEVIMVDRYHPAIQNDKDLGWISETTSKKRAFRGLTSAGKRSRNSRRKKK